MTDLPLLTVSPVSTVSTEPSPFPSPAVRGGEGAGVRDAPGSSAGERSRRGAPLGNTNALKHGFYSRSFRQIDCTDLDQVRFSGLEDEITMLRVFIRRLTDLSQHIETFPEALSLLRVLSLASISLTRLITTQNVITARSGHGELESVPGVAKALEDLVTSLPLLQTPDP